MVVYHTLACGCSLSKPTQTHAVEHNTRAKRKDIDIFHRVKFRVVIQVDTCGEEPLAMFHWVGGTVM